MFAKFCTTHSKKTKFASLTRRLGSRLSHRVLSLAAAATVAATLLPGAASAIPIIPAPSYSSYLQLGFSTETFNAPGDYVFGAVEQKVVGLPVALVHSTTTADSGGAVGELLYSYFIDGPVSEVFVPSFVTVSVHTVAVSIAFHDSAGNLGFTNNHADARFLISGFAGAEKVFSSDVADGHTVRNDFDGTLSFTALSGRVGSVFIYAAAQSAGQGGGFSDAFVDPFIFIDPAFLSTHPGYSVIVSQGIGNAAPAAPVVGAVPEPATFALLCLGLAGLGFIGRKKA